MCFSVQLLQLLLRLLMQKNQEHIKCCTTKTSKKFVVLKNGKNLFFTVFFARSFTSNNLYTIDAFFSLRLLQFGLGLLTLDSQSTALPDIHTHETCTCTCTVFVFNSLHF